MRLLAVHPLVGWPLEDQSEGQAPQRWEPIQSTCQSYASGIPLTDSALTGNSAATIAAIVCLSKVEDMVEGFLESVVFTLGRRE